MLTGEPNGDVVESQTTTSFFQPPADEDSTPVSVLLQIDNSSTDRDETSESGLNDNNDSDPDFVPPTDPTETEESDTDTHKCMMNMRLQSTRY